ncbi:MAG: hypothetical protein ACK5T0_01785 [Vampirovibrionales bacterium]|jgi:hypothetical protein
MSLINKTLRNVWKAGENALQKKAINILKKPLPIQEDIAMGVINTAGKVLHNLPHIPDAVGTFVNQAFNVLF